MLANSVFQLGRESPTYILQYLILSFGGSFILQDQIDDMEGDEAAAFYKKVTHVVMDRPLQAALLAKPDNKSKEFVQP